MCDCYIGTCHDCGCEISIHIADFCTDRSKVHPFCPKCTDRLDKNEILKYPVVFTDKGVKDDGCWCMKIEDNDKRKLKRVVFLCDDEDAYGIHLN